MRSSSFVECYASIDVESDGPAPGLNSMLSFGIAVFEQGTLTGTFSRNLELLPDAVPNPDTMEWWKTQPEAWKICRRDLVDPAKAMQEAAEWLEGFPGKVIGVGWPVAFDFAFINWYFWKFVGRNPLGFGGMDLRSYVAGLQRHPAYLGIPESEIRAIAQQKLPKGLVPHEALSDAIEQGYLLVSALEFAQKKGLESELELASRPRKRPGGHAL